MKKIPEDLDIFASDQSRATPEAGWFVKGCYVDGMLRPPG